MTVQKTSLPNFFFIFLIITLLSVSSVSAIPEADIDKFKSSGRSTFLFDDYANLSFVRDLGVKSFPENVLDMESYYVVIRRNAGDALPYDDFFVRYQCSGDATPIELHTTDYPSWVENGIVTSIKRNYYFTGESEYYDNSTINVSYAWCQVYSATDLVVDNNAGYTEFYFEIVPVHEQFVVTVPSWCGDDARADLITGLQTGIGSVLENNANFVYTLWIVFQIIAVILIVLGIPVLIFMLIRWAIWRISGFKILERSTSDVS